jgi:hypothetical protein
VVGLTRTEDDEKNIAKRTTVTSTFTISSRLDPESFKTIHRTRDKIARFERKGSTLVPRDTACIVSKRFSETVTDILDPIDLLVVFLTNNITKVHFINERKKQPKTMRVDYSHRFWLLVLVACTASRRFGRTIAFTQAVHPSGRLLMAHPQTSYRGGASLIQHASKEDIEKETTQEASFVNAGEIVVEDPALVCFCSNSQVLLQSMSGCAIV